MRNLESAMSAALSATRVSPIFLVMLTFKTGTRYVWSGVGNLDYAGSTYVGVGSLGTIGSISEGVDVEAKGTTIGLSGIDPVLQNECLSDIKLGAPAKIWFGFLDDGQIVGTPFVLFAGLVDKPVLGIGVGEITISLALESRMVDLQRATQRRYTSGDQNVAHPDDSAFDWVEILSSQALIWGS
jgi:hypothetical protein